jgi:hypothetical protein
MRRVAVPVLALLAVVTIARSGHELPIYPSYYPHEIQIATVAAEQAAALLGEGRIQAHLGGARNLPDPPPPLRAVESLGSIVVVRPHPDRAAGGDGCVLAQAAVDALAATKGDFVPHPYPVTPLHGDYLLHADLAEAAKARLRGDAVSPAAAGRLRLKAVGTAAERLVAADLRAAGAEWDAEVIAVEADELVATRIVAMNGWLGPAWVRAGWFHAHLLLADAVDDAATKDRVADNLRRLQTGDYANAVERINLERDLVAALAAGCRARTAGYTLRREFFSDDFSAGIENIAFDAIEGLASPMFIRTVKLKDFPWNGWLALGVDGRPAAAWNPVAGFTDRFGRLMWFAVGDPAALPSPNGPDWVLNRISDLRATPSR